MVLRALVVAVLCLSGSAFADVFPGSAFQRRCDVPEGCVVCASFDDSCIHDAEDAGLILSECTTTQGTPTSFVCPPGHPAVPSCGCSSAPGVVALALALLLRRRASQNFR